MLKIIANLDDYKPWSGAVSHWDYINNNDLLENFEDLMEECYPDGLSMVQLNDVLWFEWDWIREMLGIEAEED